MNEPAKTTKAKAWIGTLGALATAVSPFVVQHLADVPEPWRTLVAIALAGLTGYGVYKVENKPA